MECSLATRAAFNLCTSPVTWIQCYWDQKGNPNTSVPLKEGKLGGKGQFLLGHKGQQGGALPDLPSSAGVSTQGITTPEEWVI